MDVSKAPDPEADWLNYRSFLKVAHHVPGRLRLKVAKGAIQKFANGEARKLEAWAASLSGIEGIRVNPMALSIVIAYDKTRIGAGEWDTFFGPDEEAARLVLKRLES